MFSRSVLVKPNLTKRHLPINFKPEDAYLFSHEIEKANPPIHLAKIQHIYASSHGLVSMRLANLPQSLYSKHSSFKKKRNLPAFCWRALFHENEELDEEVMWVVDDWSHNYFHWLTDVLPRLQWIQSATSCKTLLIPQALIASDFVTSSLCLFDIQKLIAISKEQIFRCRRLLVVDTKMTTGNYDKKSIRGIRDLFINAHSRCSKDNAQARLYISRRKAGRRRLLNENEIIPILNEYDFRIVCMEEYSFEEQMRLAMSSKYIVSNHGAGMSNMLFMQAGGSVFELRREDDQQNNCYFSLASALSLNYYYQLCRAEASAKIENATNIIVLPELFRKNIRLMLNNSDGS